MKSKYKNQKKLFNDRSTYSDKEYNKHRSWANAVKQRDNGICQHSLNDRYRKHDGPIEAHHIFPKRYGGKNILSNGITLCKNCHAQFLIEAEQTFYSTTLRIFLIKLKDFINDLLNKRSQLRYFVLLDYLTGKKSFRNKQLDAVKAVIENKKNLIFVSPTGSGKSLIYQMCGILSQDQTLVISPLMALQKDQVESLWKRWIPATLINSSLQDEEKNKRLINILNKAYSFVFIHPKQLLYKDNYEDKIKIKSSNILSQAQFETLCIDEAHVVSNWGKQFIEEYSELLQIKEHYNISRTLLLSASLTKKMQIELSSKMFNKQDPPEIIVTGFYRPEIELFVETFNPLNLDEENRLDFITKLLEENKDKKIIIFVTFIKQVEDVTSYLKSQGYDAEGFHSKIINNLKSEIQNRFSGKHGKDLNILVCTSAFGMGIDISNIQLSVHYSLPFSLNDYYQQFGRIGRDGNNSKSYILYDSTESNSLVDFINSKQIEGIEDSIKKQEIEKEFEENRKELLEYINSENKWKYILDYFGEPINELNTKPIVIALIIFMLLLLLIIYTI